MGICNVGDQHTITNSEILLYYLSSIWSQSIYRYCYYVESNNTLPAYYAEGAHLQMCKRIWTKIILKQVYFPSIFSIF